MDIVEVERDLKEEDSVVTEYERKFRDRDMPIFFLKAKFK